MSAPSAPAAAADVAAADVTQSEAVPRPSIEKGRGHIFPCESCGADLEFHIGQQQLRCPFCGFSKELVFGEEESIDEQDFSAMLERLVELRREKGTGEESLKAQEVDCASCGAKVEFTGTLTSTRCPYCGSPIQREGVHRTSSRIPVDGVVPFRIEKRRAQSNLKRWVGKLWFAPNAFKKAGIDGKFDGVYLPYWTFDSMTFTRYRGKRGEHYYVTVGTGKNRTRTRRTRWYPASGRFQLFFDDVLSVAHTALPENLIRALEPWPLEEAKPFHEDILAGHTARTYDIPLDRGFEDGRQRIDEALREQVRTRIGGDTQRIDDIDTHYDAITYKHMLLPVWLLSYRYSGKVYQVVVNAATGEVQGERPYSMWKIAFTGLAVLMLVFLILSV
ncbi:MAG: hypothetical protein AAGD01_15380 [Acidobacteriota bacterium]